MDRESISSLDSKTRVALLGSLSSRRMTLSELAESHSLSKPTVSKHLGKLEDAGFVIKLDSDRKWKYYELTGKGRAVVGPDSKARLFFITLALLLAATIFYFSYHTQVDKPLSDLQAMLPSLGKGNLPYASQLPTPSPSPTPTLDIPPLPPEEPSASPIDLPALPIWEQEQPSLP